MASKHSNNVVLRRFVFTWHDYTESDVEKVITFFDNYAKYGIFGKEQCPTTKKNHLQGFCNLSKPLRFNAIKKHLDNRIHIEKANGSDEQNQTYCSKSGDVFEKGKPDKKGKRNDLQPLISAIQSGESNITAIAQGYPDVYIRYYRGIRDYISKMHPVPHRHEKTEVFYFWGPPGTGKSKSALERARNIDETSIYYKPRGLWWDGYEQQTSVIIDDFYGWIKYDEMLKICDRYPYKVQIKGGFQEFTSKFIFITSNVDTKDLYKFPGYDTAALERRITQKLYFAEE